MGQYYTSVELDFNGTEKEESQMRTLLSLMNKEEDFEEEFEDDFPLQIDDMVQNALFGKLEDRGEDSDYNCRYFPDFDLTLAPKLFASLFPDASFSLRTTYEYSVGGGETVSLAEYSDKKLTIQSYDTDIRDVDTFIEDILADLDDEELQEKYEDGDLDIEGIIKNLDSETQKEYEIIRDFENDDLDIEDLEDYLAETTKPVNMKPSRNKAYEASFFDGEDLLTYLNEEE